MSEIRPAASSAEARYSIEDVLDWLRSEVALQIVAMETHGAMNGAVGEWLVFCTARSRAHMIRLAKLVAYELKERGVLMFGQAPTIEGIDTDDWMLVDGGAVVINIMTQDTRHKLALEEHWQKLGAEKVYADPLPLKGADAFGGGVRDGAAATSALQNDDSVYADRDDFAELEELGVRVDDVDALQRHLEDVDDLEYEEYLDDDGELDGRESAHTDAACHGVDSEVEDDRVEVGVSNRMQQEKLSVRERVATR